MSSSSSALCAACGLCCNGTFFAQVTLRDDELDRLQRRGLPVVGQRERTILRLPCRAHTGVACSIYEDRPAVCARYRCRLLRNVEEGNVSFPDAMGLIQRLQRLSTAIWQALPSASREQPIFEAALAFFEGEEGLAWRRKHGELLLDMAAFLQSCRRDFGVETEPFDSKDSV